MPFVTVLGHGTFEVEKGKKLVLALEAPLGSVMSISKGHCTKFGLKTRAAFYCKFRLVREYGLGGFGCWHLGLTMPQTEEMLLEEFNIIR